MINAFVVFFGGGFGALTRYLIGTFLGEKNSYFATMAVNILGCFLIGIFFGAILHKSSLNATMKLFLIVGFCGGFTTFSAYSLDAINLLKSGNALNAILYLSSTVLLCLIATTLGILTAKLF